MEIGRIPPGGAGVGNAEASQTVIQPVSPESAAQQRELIKAVKAINASELFGQDNELTFVFDRETHRTVARIVKKDTREIIMQVPPEYVIRMAEDLKQA
jgi:flagellar protein FlaG